MPIILQSRDPDLAVLVNGNTHQLQQKPHLSNLYLQRQLEQHGPPFPMGARSSALGGGTILGPETPDPWSLTQKGKLVEVITI